MSKVASTILTVVLAAICAILYYLALPAITLRSPGFWGFLLFCAACVAISLSMFFYEDHPGVVAAAWIGVGAVLLGLLVCWVSSWMMFHSQKAYEVADVTISPTSIADDFADLSDEQNLSNLPLVDLDTARMLGDKKVAKLQHASWYDVDDEYNLVKTPDGYYRLSVVDYGDYWKYRKAKTEGLPGYVLVGVTPENGAVTQDATVVELDDAIRYSPGAFWSYDLKRHLRVQYPSYVLDDSYLEIDDEGNPFWVTGVLRPTAGAFGVKTVTTFILTNAQTGASQEYNVENAPEWIDHIFSLRYLMQIAYWHYAYADGFWNNALGKTNVWRTSYEYRDKQSSSSESAAGKFANFFGYSSIVDKNGEVLFYTGLTAANNAESNLGWLTIDISTGKMTQYNVVGAEESSAQSAVEQLVQAQGYEATFPLPANIAGQPSYIMCLKGKAGLAQAYGICNVENYSIAVQAETLDQAIRLYQQKLGYEITTMPVDTSALDDEQETKASSGIIEAIYTAEINGTTQFYYLVDGQLYRAPITINELQITFKVGDKIIFCYYVAADNMRRITSIHK